MYITDIRHRGNWLILIFATGVATILVGQYWLFADAVCRHLQDTLLYSVTIVLVAVMLFRAITVRSVSLLDKLNALATVFIVGLVVPAIGGPFLSQFPEVRATYCPSCYLAIGNAEQLRLAARNATNPVAPLDAAEFYLRTCVAQRDPQWNKEAETLLARTLYEKAGLLIDRNICAEAQSATDEAYSLMVKYGDSDLLELITERNQVLKLVCAKSATPTPSPPPTAISTPTILAGQTPISVLTITPTPTTNPSGNQDTILNVTVIVALIGTIGAVIGATLNAIIGLIGQLATVWLKHKLEQGNHKTTEQGPEKKD